MNKYVESLSDIEILTLTLTGEARGEPIEGIIACACVIRNRVHSGKYISYRHACLAQNQFSCWNEDDSNYPLLIELAEKMIMGQNITDIYIRQCLWVAKGIIDWSIRDNTNSSLNYVTKALWDKWEIEGRPKWAKNSKIKIEKGNHVYFEAA